VGLVTIFYCLKLETPPTWRARPPYLYPPGTGWPSCSHRHWVPFSLPPTRRATMEVFDPASTRERGTESEPDSYVTTDGQSASLSWNKASTWGLRPDFFLLSDRPPLWSSGESSWLQIQRSPVRFPALPDFLRSNASGTGSARPCEYN
jgi:hypothetical protein